MSTHVLVWAAVARKIRPSPETVGQPVVRPIEQVDVEEGPTNEGGPDGTSAES